MDSWLGAALTLRNDIDRQLTRCADKQKAHQRTEHILTDRRYHVYTDRARPTTCPFIKSSRFDADGKVADIMGVIEDLFPDETRSKFDRNATYISRSLPKYEKYVDTDCVAEKGVNDTLAAPAADDIILSAEDLGAPNPSEECINMTLFTDPFPNLEKTSVDTSYCLDVIRRSRYQ